MYRLIRALLFAWAVVSVVAEKTITLTLLRNQPVLSHHRALSKKRQTVETAQLNNLFGREYAVEIGIGTPPQRFNVSIDTGSPVLWVASSRCLNIECPVAKFATDASSTYETGFDVFQLKYFLGYVSGDYGSDTVTIGDGLTVTRQSLGIATSTSDVLTDAFANPSSGILGLSFQVPGLNSGEPFVSRLVKDNLITSPVFSVYMNSQYQYGYRGNAVITFGGVDSTKYNGQLQYADVQRYTVPLAGIIDEYIYWSVRGAGVTVTSANGETTYNHNLSDNIVFDTGSTVSYAPASVVRGIVDAITTTANYSQEEQVYIIDCDIPDSTITLKVAGADGSIIDLPVSVREMIYPLDTLDPRDAKQCVLALAPLDEGSSVGSYMTYLIGQSVMRSLYTVHDVGNHRMGFAKAILSPLSNDSLNRTRPLPSNTDRWRPMQPTRTPGGNFEPSSGSIIATTFGCSNIVALMILALVVLY
ncbi:aspartic peptidase domain-containing protein [Fennellomyces sp. T-0311]|nr:aspartic peptidase domain-containing protein [Fennellomyces sp. T-0311]